MTCSKKYDIIANIKNEVLHLDEAQAVLHQNKVRESLYLRLAAEVLPSAALCHQIVLRLLVQKFRCGHDDKFARRILGTHLLLVCDHSNSRDGVWRAA